MFGLIVVAWILVTLNPPTIIWVCYGLWCVAWTINIGIEIGKKF
jgi:hypothetical protein